MDLFKIEIGQTLTKEEWLWARDNLAEAFVYFGEYLKQINFEGQGERDKSEFLLQAGMAINAMTYVAEFATDKCRFMILPEEKK